jgi:Xaa-Pro dipeptidase
MLAKPTSDEFNELRGLPNSMFSSNRERFIKNLMRLLPDLDTNSVLVLRGGNEISKYDSDTIYFHFYQEANIYYLTGITEPDMIAIVDIKTTKMIIFYNQPSEENRIWMTVLSKEDIQKKYDCEVYDQDKLHDYIKNRDPKNILILEGNNDYSGLPVTTMTLNFQGEFEYLKQRILHDKIVYEILKDTRTRKSPEELKLMQFICDITVYAHKIMQKGCKPGLYERDLETTFMNTLNKEYYTRHWAYPCIGGTGCNSAILHYENNEKMLKDGDLFLADMGIRFCNYTSDVTCTFPVNGKFTKKQKDIYNLVLKSNRETMNMIRPGVAYMDMDKKSKLVILEGLQELGLIKSNYSVDELFNDRIQTLFMPHGLGHLVGIEVHDVGRLISFKPIQILEKGNVITVEPGIYFVEFAFENAFNDPKKSKYLNKDLIRQYYNFGGVRIEDDVIVTDTGFINMTEGVPRTVEDIENWMNS